MNEDTDVHPGMCALTRCALAAAHSSVACGRQATRQVADDAVAAWHTAYNEARHAHSRPEFATHSNAHVLAGML